MLSKSPSILETIFTDAIIDRWYSYAVKIEEETVWSLNFKRLLCFKGLHLNRI